MSDALKVMKGVVEFPKPTDFTIVNKYGRFHVTDFGVVNMLRPHHEIPNRAIISSLSGSLFVDIGANIGVYSVMAAKNGNEVMAFEPNPRTYKFLVENTHMNNVEVEAMPFAVWDKESFVDLEIGYFSRATRTKEGRAVRAVTLDSVLGGRIPDLVKIDVEDSEMHVFKGMTSTLSKAKDMRIIYEARSDEKLREDAGFLSELGYKTARLDAFNFLAIRNKAGPVELFTRQ